MKLFGTVSVSFTEKTSDLDSRTDPRWMFSATVGTICSALVDVASFLSLASTDLDLDDCSS